MIPTDSPSASSPFSPRSTLVSSPDVSASGELDGNKKVGVSVLGMSDGLMNGITGTYTGAYNSFSSNDAFDPHHKTSSPPTAYPPSHSVQHSIHHHRSHPATRAASATASTSRSSAHQGEPKPGGPKRQIDVDDLPIGVTDHVNLAMSSGNNYLLCQGDPHEISKQRVETAIRVIFDILRLIPASPSLPPLPPALHPLLLMENGAFVSSLERVATFRTLRLQAGTTTKKMSKKQQSAGETPNEQLLYLETAVYTSGDNTRRVYVCNKCRARESRRKRLKDAGRKQGVKSGSECSVPAKQEIEQAEDVKPNINGSSVDVKYINGENPDSYRPIQEDQVVEEPAWDPDRADWRHNIVLFNSPPEVPIRDGSCYFLPFRVVCYGKCHGAREGFIVRFILRLHSGEIIATASTPPIKITDDHKTGTSKPKARRSSASQSAAPRKRKGRPPGSATSSRRQSPTPSEPESIQSVLSEVGAIQHRQTASVRAGKPYGRPPPQSPLTPMEGLPSVPDVNRADSNVSIHAVASISPLPVRHEPLPRHPFNTSAEYPPFDQRPSRGMMSPGRLRKSDLSFTNLQGLSSMTPSTSRSAASSNVASPRSQSIGLPRDQDDMLFEGQDSQRLIDALMISPGPDHSQRYIPTDPMLSGLPSDGLNIDTSSSFGNLDAFRNLSSQASALSDYDNASGMSSSMEESSINDDASDAANPMHFFDFNAADADTATAPALNQPNFSPAGGPSIDRRAFSSTSPLTLPSNGNPYLHPRQDMTRMLEMMMSQHMESRLNFPAVPPPQLAASLPVIDLVVPATGPVAGGTQTALIGKNFAPDSVVFFADRPAQITTISANSIVCLSPPGVTVGPVEVTVGNLGRTPGTNPTYYTYEGMDQELMKALLQVHNVQNPNDPYFQQLVQQWQSRPSGGDDRSDKSSSGSSNSGISPPQQSLTAFSFASSPLQPRQSVDDLQATAIAFLSSLDSKAPGSLRRSGAVNTRNSYRRTLCHIAAIMGFHKIVRRLVVYGADLDMQDTNGYTALGLACLSGQNGCARVLIEAGAAYDRPTFFGEMPLDLAKPGDHAETETLLLSAVWPTKTIRTGIETRPAANPWRVSQIDNDNLSSGSDIEEATTMNKPRRTMSRKTRGKQRGPPPDAKPSPRPGPKLSRRSSMSFTRDSPPLVSPTHSDDPPPYDSANAEFSWMSLQLGLNRSFRLPVFEAVWERLPPPLSNFLGDKAHEQGWSPFSASTWDALHKMASTEEVKLFTQAMAAAAFNAVVQTGATADDGDVRRVRGRQGKRGKRRRGSEDGASPTGRMVEHVKRDRMLYLFWLPILLFVGFWLLVTALPLAFA